MTTESPEEEPSGKMLQCSHCSKEFKYNSERNRHELSHFPRFECEVCCKKFSFISALRRHQKQHARTGSVQCDECNRKFRDEVLLKRHMKYAHKGTFKCTKCNTPFSSDQALSTHMKTHKPESERRFKCSFEGCEKSFNFSHHLKHHELTHTNAKQHYCSVCGKGFIQSHHLKSHLKTHNPSEWLYCEFAGCKKKFSTEYARKRHMATHKIKPDSGISSDSSSCDASFPSKDYVTDFILCDSCGENIPKAKYTEHSAKCDDILNISVTRLKPGQGNDSKMMLKNDDFDEKTKLDVDNGIGECKTALGGCITSPNNCVCEQISTPINENLDFTPIGSRDDFVTVEKTTDIKDNVPENKFKMCDHNDNEAVLTRSFINESIEEVENFDNFNLCEGCECASTCNIKEPLNCSFKSDQDVPNVEYRLDGVIKIRDTFDVDIPVKPGSNDESQIFNSFSTCRDVIGNCIAGTNEGCLCARMMMDEQPASAQEIDDITPNPKTEF